MMKIILDMTHTHAVCYSHGGRNRPDAERRESKMQLHPSVMRQVKRLIAEGRVGPYPFGIALEVWIEEIARKERERQLELLPSVGWGNAEMTQSEINRQLKS